VLLEVQRKVVKRELKKQPINEFLVEMDNLKNK